MIGSESGICVHLLDPMPGAVVARLTDGLRERGHRVELRGDTFASYGASCSARVRADAILAVDSTRRGPGRREPIADVFLTSRPLEAGDGTAVSTAASPEHHAAIVGVPEAAGPARFAPELASRVLNLVLRELKRL